MKQGQAKWDIGDDDDDKTTGPIADEEEEDDEWEEDFVENDIVYQSFNDQTTTETEQGLLSNPLHRHYEPGAHKRPNVIQPPPSTLSFQLTETTYYVQSGTEIPMIRLWGITAEGNSVMVEDSTFRPYFYVGANNAQHASYLREKMELMYRNHFDKKNGQIHIGKYIRAVEPVQGRTLMGYHCNAPLGTLYKFTVALPIHVSTGRDWLESANRNITDVKITTYEGNVPYELRYMIDRNIHGGEWIEIQPDAFGYAPVKRTHVQLEAYITKPSGLRALRPEERGDIAPIRILGYDIEVNNRDPGFPAAGTKPVIMICCVLYTPSTGTIHKACFALSTRARYRKLEGADIWVFEKETDLLRAFHQYVHECDPEGFTGWNTNNFDMPFLLARAERLKMGSEFSMLSRVKGVPLWVRKTTYQSKASGARSNNEVTCEGRFDFDGLTFMLRGVMRKFRLNTLNNIAKELLGEEKADVDHTQIPDLFESEYDEDCTRLLHYCLRDTELVITILHKQMALVNCIEQARVTGVSIKWLLSRGQGIKTYSNILRHKLPVEFVPSKANKANQSVTGGGHVEDPERGFYPYPVITEDFASLYPSIMIAYNICYTTVVSLAWARANLKPEDYWIPFPSVDAPDLHKSDKAAGKPTGFASLFGATRPIMEPARKKNKKEREREEEEAPYAGKEPEFCFVKKHIREGVLPAMLAKLLKARSSVKYLMKTAAGFLYGVLDGRQLALKVVCNSVYGFLKAFTIVDPRLMAAVTSYGRNMLRIVKHTVRTEFNRVEIIDVETCIARNIDPEDETNPNRPTRFACGKIVYGDTDSVMISFGPITLADSVRLGRAISKSCTSKFESPNKLEFETIKLRSGYMNKKRYMALYIEEFKDGERFADAIKRGKVTMKGLEGARRDNARIGSRTQTEAATVLLKTGDIEQAEAIVKKVLSDLYCNRVDMSDLIITKGLSKTDEQYAKGGTIQQHVAVQQRMRARAHVTGEVVPATGDRVPYVMIYGPKDSSAGDRSEHPIYVQKNSIPIDIEYYVYKQVWPAVIRIFTAYHEPKRCVEIEGSMSQKNRQTLIAHKRLFSDSLDHMRERKRPRQRKHIAVDSCYGCNLPMRGRTVCCEPASVKMKLETTKEKTDAVKQKAWERCRVCQGGNFEKVSCANLSCTNFFHRTAASVDFEDACADLASFVEGHGSGRSTVH